MLRTQLPKTKIILLTMYGDQISNKVAKACGVNRVVTKPDAGNQLMPAMETLLFQSLQDAANESRN